MGEDGEFMVKEVYVYVFDGILIFLVLIFFNWVYFFVIINKEIMKCFNSVDLGNQFEFVNQVENYSKLFFLG